LKKFSNRFNSYQIKQGLLLTDEPEIEGAKAYTTDITKQASLNKQIKQKENNNSGQIPYLRLSPTYCQFTQSSSRLRNPQTLLSSSNNCD
jgi:hypothetical protein